MEMLPENEDEVKDLLNRHEKGLTAAELFSSGKSFCERTDLARVLHVLAQQGVIYKAGDRYILTSNSPSPDESCNMRDAPPLFTPRQVEAVKDSPRPVAAVPEKKWSVEVKESRSAKPWGGLRRGSVIGTTALVLWTYRNEGYALTIERIREAVGPRLMTGNGVYPTLAQLVDEEYAYKCGSGKGVAYKWSGSWEYPYESVLPEDEATVLVLPGSKREEGSHKVAERVLVTNQRDSKQDGVYKVIAGTPVSEVPIMHQLDAAIASQEAHLQMLRSIRKLICM